MIITNESRRSVLKGILSSVCVSALLPGCESEDTGRRDVIENVLNLLRHHGVAAHLGRIEVEATPELQSMTLEQMAADILSAINLDINAIDDGQTDSINERLSIKIRQDFTHGVVTTVDGWLLSVTEARVCALVYLHLTQTIA